MRNFIMEELAKKAKVDQDIVLMTADLGYSVVEPFSDNLPDQFVNGGIAEQNLVSVAAGLAKEGKKVFLYSMGNFLTLRCIEQIRDDCAFNNFNVNIICVGGGLTYGSLGMTHHSTEDIAMMRSLPNVVVATPADKKEAECILNAITEIDTTCYIRLGRGGEEDIHTSIDNYKLGDSVKIKDGNEIALFSIGPITSESIKVCEKLNNKGISTALYTFPTVKPLDEETIISCAEKNKLIVTVEEHNKYGGFGGAVSEVLAQNSYKASQLTIALDDTYVYEVGTQDYLRKIHRIDADSIEERILKKYDLINSE